MEVVPVGPEMIVDDIEQHHQPARVRLVDETLEAVGTAIGDVRRVEQDAVVAPAAVAGELRHRHQLDGRDARIDEMVELGLDAGERAILGEGAGVQLVDDGLVPRPALPLGRLPGVGARIDQQRGSVHVAGLRPRGGVGHLHAAVAEREGIRLAHGNGAALQREPAVARGPHRLARAARRCHQRDGALSRRPDPEPRRAVAAGLRAPRSGEPEAARHLRRPSSSSTARAGSVISEPGPMQGLVRLDQAARRIDDEAPARHDLRRRHLELNVVVVRIEQHQQRHRPALRQHQPERTREAVGPVPFRHLLGIRPQPRHVARPVAQGPLAVQKAPLAQQRQSAAHAHQSRDELEEGLVAIAHLFPVHPGQLVVLAIGVVVAGLRAPDLVAHQQHGRSLREQQSAATAPRRMRSRRSPISGSSETPSTPQFQLRLSSCPSRLSSPLASLCLSL